MKQTAKLCSCVGVGERIKLPGFPYVNRSLVNSLMFSRVHVSVTQMFLDRVDFVGIRVVAIAMIGSANNIFHTC